MVFCGRREIASVADFFYGDVPVGVRGVFDVQETYEARGGGTTPDA